MKLYYMVPFDSSGKVRWLLNELGVSYEDVKLSYKAGDTKKPEYLAKHPLGQVPVLEDGDLTLFESYAMVSYLADKYIDKGLAPKPHEAEKRAEYYKWLFFSSNSAEKFFDNYYRMPKMTEEYKADWGDYTVDKVQKILLTVENRLEGRDYILGDFSAVDTCLGYALGSVSEENFFNDFPRVKSYFLRLKDREACVKSEIFKSN